MVTELTRQRLAALREHLERAGSGGRWLVLTHDNPDPDALTGAAILARILTKGFHRRVTTAYGGLIGRAENRELFKTLRHEFSQMRHLNLNHYQHFALIDAQPGTGNSQLPDDAIPDLVIDHHPMRKATYRVPVADVRSDYGATVTILAEYLEALGIKPTRSQATALLYALRVETGDFGRQFTPMDKAVYDAYLPLINRRALARIQTANLPVSYFATLSQALSKLESVDTLVISHLGAVAQPDIVPEFADLLLRMEGKTWSLVTGLYEDRIYLSMRTSNPRADAGRLMRRLIGRRGKGGGHGMTAGGWVDAAKAPNGEPILLQRQLGARLATLLKKNPDRIGPIVFDPNRSGNGDGAAKSTG